MTTPIIIVCCIVIPLALLSISFIKSNRAKKIQRLVEKQLKESKHVTEREKIRVYLVFLGEVGPPGFEPGTNTFLNKMFKFKINFNLHNASNDCIVTYRSLRKLINIYGKKEFENMISQNKELVKF